MITSSNFFNKTIFNAQQDYQIQPAEVGPWHMSRHRKFGTVDINRKTNNKSQNRYKSINPYGADEDSKERLKRRYLEGPNRNCVQSINIQLQRQSIDINQKAKRLRQKSKKNSLFPYIDTPTNKKLDRYELITSRKQYSPLAYELNFITKKPLKRARKKGYLSDYTTNGLGNSKNSISRIERYFLNESNSKYNIYQKCVVEIKKVSNKSKQLFKN